MKAVLDGLCYLHGTGLAFRAALAKEKQSEKVSQVQAVNTFKLGSNSGYLRINVLIPTFVLQSN
jgi:hypothetical protein